MTFLKGSITAAAIVCAGAAASAATVQNSSTIDIGDRGRIHTVLDANQTATYTFIAQRDLRIADLVTISAEAFAFSDVAQLRFGFSDVPVSDAFGAGEIEDGVVTFGAVTQRPGFVLAAGESFSFSFDNQSDDEVSTQLLFKVAAVPAPAAGILLLTALAGGGMLARRKKASA